MGIGDCGFCGRKIKVPLVRARGMGFCCTSCFRAYETLHPSAPPSTKKTGKPEKKAKQHVKRKQKRR